MKKLIITLGLMLALVMSVSVQAQKLGNFGSSVEKKIGPKTIRVPYLDQVSYLGYATVGTEDEVKDGKKYYYIYIWVPLVAPELGVRMMSPAKDMKLKDAKMSSDYKEHEGDSDFFDTYITLEKSDISKKKEISAEAVANATWTVLDRNDDSSEMPAQPSGSNYNSLLRYKSQTSDPLKALTAGLYRVGFTTYKTGEVKGTFLAQIAAPIKIPGIEMAKTIEELLELLAKE